MKGRQRLLVAVLAAGAVVVGGAALAVPLLLPSRPGPVLTGRGEFPWDFSLIPRLAIFVAGVSVSLFLAAWCAALLRRDN